MPIDIFTLVDSFRRLRKENLYVSLSNPNTVNLRIYSRNVLILLYLISIISEIMQQHNLYLKTQQNSEFFRESLQSPRKAAG